MPNNRDEEEASHKKQKRSKSKNIWTAAQKARGWNLFEEGDLDPELLPKKKDLLEVVAKHREFEPFLGPRYPQLRSHLRKLATKFILRNEIKHHRRQQIGKWFLLKKNAMYSSPL